MFASGVYSTKKSENKSLHVLNFLLHQTQEEKQMELLHDTLAQLDLWGVMRSYG